MNDLARLLGDHAGQPALLVPQSLVTPRRLAVWVARRGTDVLVRVGNADAARLPCADAMRMALAWMREAVRARRQGRPAEVRLAGKLLRAMPAAVMEVGKQVLSRGAEGKFLRGDAGRLDSE